MNDLSFTTDLMAYIGTNLLGLLMLPIAYFWPRVMRVLFVVMFGAAAAINYYMATYHPEAYLTYANTAIPLYRAFILGWFSNHLSTVVYSIAIAQGMIATGLLLKGIVFRLSMAGIIVFLLCITPLGIRAAFPFSLQVSLAAYWVIRRDTQGFIWGKLRRT